MSFSKQSPGRSSVVAALSAVAMGSALSLGLSAPASAGPEAPDLAGLTDVVSELPVSSAAPANLAPLEGVPGSDVVMQQNGQTKKYGVQPISVDREGQQLSALPLTPDQGLGQGLPATPSLTEAVPGESIPDDKLGNVNWVLAKTNGGALDTSDPTDVTAITDMVTNGVDAEVGQISSKDVTTATQAAVWHYSSGADLAEQGNSPQVTELYEYLTGPANTGAPLSAPQTQMLSAPAEPGLPSTDDLPAALDGMQGQVMGPLSLAEGFDQATLEGTEAPNGVSVIDTSGAKVTQMRGGTDYFLHVPEGAGSGKAILSMLGAPQDLTGQILSTLKDGKATDALLVTGGQAPMHRTTSVGWETKAAGAGGALPMTGSAIAGIIAVGAGAVIGGVVLYTVASRRRKASVTE